MGNSVFRYFLEWLKNEMHEEAYKRLLKNVDKREKINRGRKKEESAAFLGPGWGAPDVGSQTQPVKHDARIIEYSVTDQMYTLANSVVNSFDGLWHTYVVRDGVSSLKPIPPPPPPPPPPTENFLDDFSEWQKSNKGKKHPHLWELAQAEGDEDWLNWIHDHVWTYIGLSAPLLGAINPVRAFISGENMGMPMNDKDARKMEMCKCNV
jgi:hypothetical protein